MTYSARIEWSGSTGAGWESYDRTHAALVAEQVVSLTTGEAKGDPRLANPEQLLLAAASSCQMLWFLHLASKARIDVVAYEDDCVAEMPGDRFERVVLRPRIRVSGGADAERVRRLAEQAHRHCNVAKSLSCPVEIQPELA